MTKTRFRADINALRALAVSLVVLFHFKIRGFEGGFLGVDIFFVISGYLMTKIIVTDLIDGTFSYLQFLGMRIARIWMALVALVICLLVLGAFLLSPIDYAELAVQAKSALLFYSNFYFDVGRGYFNTGPEERWLLHTWSLSVEWQFYMLYPLLLIGIAALSRRLAVTSQDGMRRHMLVGLSVMTALSWLAGLWMTHVDQVGAFFLLPSRAWEMMAGGVIFLLEPVLAVVGPRRQTVVRLSGFVALLAVGLIAGRYSWESQWPGLFASAPILLTALVLAIGTNADYPAPRWMTVPVVQKLGLWSYSIYLWHWPIVISINFLDIENEHKRYAKLIGIALSIMLGATSYHFVEKFFTFKRLSSVFQKSVMAPLLGAALVLILSIGIVLSDGWIGRVSGDRAFYENYKAAKSEKLFPASCDNFKKPASELTLCSINASAPGPKTLVYGDSHAEHLYAWFARHATTPVDFFTSSGCPPAPGFNRRDPGFHCQDYVREALERAGSSKYQVIIVAGNWGNGMDQIPGNLCKAYDLAPCGKNDPPAARTLLVKANADAWTHLLNIGKTLVIVDQSPVAGFEVMPTVMRRRFLKLKPIDTFTETRPPGAGPSLYIDDVVAAMPSCPALHRVSLRSEFCKGSVCETTDEQHGMPFLLDQSHFAPWWIRDHGGAFSEFVASH